ncbi:hypothetical protein SKAU_G00391710 [Synaphobranchus kaupii]|uniref:Uncharacterized protein n=1 Tax=Synaphobranchus kaupii TaxID=118154 RepID=A0A9Q1EBP0_SYNKA|nr:hypothetical protein SKAU_G00391710 [Synaphobranchus kaupii]
MSVPQRHSLAQTNFPPGLEAGSFAWSVKSYQRDPLHRRGRPGSRRRGFFIVFENKAASNTALCSTGGDGYQRP